MHKKHPLNSEKIQQYVFMLVWQNIIRGMYIYHQTNDIKYCNVYFENIDCNSRK